MAVFKCCIYFLLLLYQSILAGNVIMIERHGICLTFRLQLLLLFSVSTVILK